jgi:protein gp37
MADTWDCPLAGCTDVYSRCDLCGAIDRVLRVQPLGAEPRYECVDLMACRIRRKAAMEGRFQ